MKTRGKGVSFYKTGTAMITVNFPEGETVCRWCPYIRYDESLKRHRCFFSGEYLMFPMESLGVQCPIYFEENENVKTDLCNG